MWKRLYCPSMLLGLTLLLALAGSACSGSKDSPDGGDAGLDASDGADAGDQDEAVSISSVVPNRGPVEGGLQVGLTGRGFQAGASVSFGPNDATDVTILTASQLTATLPSGAGPGVVAVIVRNIDGSSATLPNGFTYQESINPPIGWCVLQSPAATSTDVNAATETIFGRVYAEGCSEGQAQCVAVQGELGMGAQGTDPSADPASWAWTGASYNPAHGADDNDEHMAELVPGTAGTFAYAYRFSSDGGANWTYCDLDGSDNGFQTGQLGQLTVADQALSIGWCNLQSPAATQTDPGLASEPFYGRVFVAGCSEADQQCAGIQAQVGHGDPAIDPSQQAELWTWTGASYNPGHTDDDNDEYAATLTEAVVGTYATAFRFSLNGVDWSYCDLDGTSNGFQTDQLGALDVSQNSLEIGWCNLQHPPSLTLDAGNTSEPVYGRLLVSACSEGASFCDGISAELGSGDPAVDPSLDPGAWTWLPAAYNPGHTDDDNDEYQVQLTPQSAGTFGYVYRFSGDGGQTWSYCDLTGSSDGFSVADAGTLTVN